MTVLQYKVSKVEDDCNFFISVNYGNKFKKDLIIDTNLTPIKDL